MDFTDYDPDERYARYAEAFEQPSQRSKRPRQHARTEQPIATLVDMSESNGFQTTYQPARYEAIWLQESLRSFYDEQLIADIQAQIKGGKEASVYRCVAPERRGGALVAAKIYRPRMFRNLRNDKLYRDGRTILTSEGQAVKKTDHRIMRAIGKKTAFGEQVKHTSWVMHEFTTMQQLYLAGAAVPQPIAAAENAILMTYYGDQHRAAPTLFEANPHPREAPALFREAMRNIELLLQHGIIHGDLSAYNMLYWQGRIVLIDFPQVVNIHTNQHAAALLARDIARVCSYFA